MHDEQPRPEPNQTPAARRAQLARRVLDLKRRGASIREAAEALGISKSAAGRLYLKELARMKREAASLGQFARTAEADRLESLVLAVNRKIADPDISLRDFLGAVKVLIDLSARKSKLLGLDADGRLAVYTPYNEKPVLATRPVTDEMRVKAITELLQRAGTASDAGTKPGTVCR
jgi:hypothetical protein